MKYWILAKLRSIADRLLAKVRGEGKAIRTVEVRVRYNDFDECRRSESLKEPTDLGERSLSSPVSALEKGVGAACQPSARLGEG